MYEDNRILWESWSRKIYISKYGMDSSVGLCSLDDEKTITEDVRSRINSLLNEELKNAVDIIQNNRSIIDALVDALMKKRSKK